MCSRLSLMMTAMAMTTTDDADDDDDADVVDEDVCPDACLVVPRFSLSPSIHHLRVLGFRIKKTLNPKP